MDTDINAAVRVEMARFRAALPELLKGPLAGKWVVFKDGKVCGTFDSSMAAHRAGVGQFGALGGQVVAQIVKEEPKPVSAAAELFWPTP